MAASMFFKDRLGSTLNVNLGSPAGLREPDCIVLNLSFASPDPRLTIGYAGAKPAPGQALLRVNQGQRNSRTKRIQCC
jgi:hypothetical protein